MKIIVVAQEKLITLLNVLKTSSTEVKYVIKIGNFVSNEEKQAAKDAKVSLLYFQGVEAMGLDHPRDPVNFNSFEFQLTM